MGSQDRADQRRNEKAAKRAARRQAETNLHDLYKSNFDRVLAEIRDSGGVCFLLERRIAKIVADNRR